uniref:Uncharacterized protein, isoform C n=1 Tax=Drosophila melanogaster TaxID=7227 RepID=M9NHA4_DROME|nr:uncharacterized protein Dmel_CG7990, isoform C [Drosophila melanogaster]AFH07457.1 uncharacterized protein Dmel_CG7990, isoform C [Drosophila melanogaster]|eukprot:NP_001245744.1 uncharacterized protein Dmel_CG7990, isoform C [Drosophila melanogaster]
MQQSTGAATSSAADSGMGATDLVSRCVGDGGGGGGNSCSGGSSDPAARFIVVVH